MQITEIEIANISSTHNGYQVDFTHVQTETEDYKFVKYTDLKEHVTDWNLNAMHDFPEYGDITPLDYATWLKENETFAIEHYLTNNK